MSMRRSFAALVVSTMLVSWPAPADDAGSATCSGTWVASRVCHFWFRGFPLVLSAEATQGGAEAWVRVWISLDAEGNAPIVECTAQGANHTCSNGLPDETCECPWYGGANALQLSCHVQGAPRGRYRCISGSGQ